MGYALCREHRISGTKEANTTHFVLRCSLHTDFTLTEECFLKWVGQSRDSKNQMVQDCLSTKVRDLAVAEEAMARSRQQRIDAFSKHFDKSAQAFALSCFSGWSSVICSRKESQK